jgi:hypothetical protein
MKVSNAYFQHLIDTLWDVGDSNDEFELVSDEPGYNGSEYKVFKQLSTGRYWYVDHCDGFYSTHSKYVEFEEVFPKEITTTIYVTKEQLDENH